MALGLLLSAPHAHADETAPASPTDGTTAAPAPAAPNALDTLRERFREGMDKYKAGAFADAVVIWEFIYRELGTDKGYRLAFDLARAYDELGDLIKAADHYESYLERVTQRRTIGETLEANVERQEAVARERLEKIAALKARIRVKAGARQPVIVQVDNSPARVAGFTQYVEPGAHVVTFGTGKEADARRLTVVRGAIVDVEPREETPRAPPPEPRFETHVRASVLAGRLVGRRRGRRRFARPSHRHVRERTLDQERARRPRDLRDRPESPAVRLLLRANQCLRVGRGAGGLHRRRRRARALVRPRHQGDTHSDHAVCEPRTDRHVARRLRALLTHASDFGVSS